MWAALIACAVTVFVTGFVAGVSVKDVKAEAVRGPIPPASAATKRKTHPMNVNWGRLGPMEAEELTVKDLAREVQLLRIRQGWLDGLTQDREMGIMVDDLPSATPERFRDAAKKVGRPRAQ